MPNHDTHCHQSMMRYGKSFSELHRWMDEPCKILGPSHRIIHHDILTTPSIARQIFGEFADQACIDHILLDHGEIPLTIKSDECVVVPSVVSFRVKEPESKNEKVECMW